MATKTYTIQIDSQRFSEFYWALLDKAHELQDDGRDDNPTSKLVYEVARQLKAQESK